MHTPRQVVYGCVIPFNNVASSILLERDLFKEQPSAECALLSPGECQTKANPPNSYCELGGHWQPPLPDMVDREAVVCAESEWLTREPPHCAKDYCASEVGAVREAAQVFSVPYLMSAVLSPFLGGAVDLLGGRAFLCLASSLLLVAVHSLLAWSTVTPYLPMAGQGLAYSMFASALWDPLIYS